MDEARAISLSYSGSIFAAPCSHLRRRASTQALVRSGDCVSANAPGLVKRPFASRMSSTLLVNTAPFNRYVAEARAPGKNVTCDDEWPTSAAPSATPCTPRPQPCRMGSDAGSVVDQQLRVRGVAGLKVIDASTMPAVVSGNTNAAVVAIAEKGADLICGR